MSVPMKVISIVAAPTKPQHYTKRLLLSREFLKTVKRGQLLQRSIGGTTNLTIFLEKAGDTKKHCG